MVSQDLGSAIDNYVGVFRCEPVDQAKSQLRQLIQAHPSIGVGQTSSAVMQDYENQINALIKGNEKLLARAEDAESQIDALKKWNEKLKKTVQKQEKDLADERTQRELHESTLDAAGDRVGGGRHNLLERIDELIEKEKEHFKPKSKKKEKP